MEVLLKVCALALIGVFSVGALRRTMPEMSVAATVATQLVLIFAASGIIGNVIEFIYDMTSRVGVSDELISPLIKTVGVSIVAKISCDMCRENGLISAASYIEIVGGAVAISFSMPLMLSVLSQITG